MHSTYLSGRAVKESRATSGARRALRTGLTRFLPAGFSLVEMIVSLAIILVMISVALPFLFGNRKSYHLTQAATAASGAIQATRYQAIMTGCPYSITFTQGTTTYQVQNRPLTGTPPACSGTWTNLGALTPWSTNSDVSVNATTTLQFCPNGTQTTTASNPPCPGTVTWGSLVFSNGFTTNTVTVSGVGNVAITQP